MSFLADLFGGARRAVERDLERRLGEVRAELQLARDTGDMSALASLRDRLPMLELTEDEAALELEMAEGLVDTAALRTAFDRGDGLPLVATSHRALNGEPCHFLAPAWQPDGEGESGGRHAARRLGRAAADEEIGASRLRPGVSPRQPGGLPSARVAVSAGASRRDRLALAPPNRPACALARGGPATPGKGAARYGREARGRGAPWRPASAGRQALERHPASPAPASAGWRPYAGWKVPRTVRSKVRRRVSCLQATAGR
jgi:hypothetical protein